MKQLHEFWKWVRGEWVLILTIILIALAAFGLGRLSVAYGTHDTLKIVDATIQP